MNDFQKLFSLLWDVHWLHHRRYYVDEQKVCRVTRDSSQSSRRCFACDTILLLFIYIISSVGMPAHILERVTEFMKVMYRVNSISVFVHLGFV